LQDNQINCVYDNGKGFSVKRAAILQAQTALLHRKQIAEGKVNEGTSIFKT
jgi:hypothetical protein